MATAVFAAQSEGMSCDDIIDKLMAAIPADRKLASQEAAAVKKAS